jgi:hypothetical protein
LENTLPNIVHVKNSLKNAHSQNQMAFSIDAKMFTGCIDWQAGGLVLSADDEQLLNVLHLSKATA